MTAENRFSFWNEFSTAKVFSPIVRRPALLGISVAFSLLLATGFFAYRQKPELIFGSKTSVTDSWPSSQFWGHLSSAARSTNRCPYSGCSAAAVQNRSRLSEPFNSHLTAACPSYFGWIYEDLAPWAKDGISEETLRKGRSKASFRVVIKNGRLFVDPYTPCFQTRAVFTVWGLLQLLNFYPGLVPDVDLFFACGDYPRLLRKDYIGQSPPPLFSYCNNADTVDIPFPDWSFWGWPEVDLSSWDVELCGILKGENELVWEKRRPTAFWKGNTDTGGGIRHELKKCDGRYSAQILHQDWGRAIQNQFRNSRLGRQCNNRYKIYVEGWGWSVSLKYILACDSPVLLVDPFFGDFFSRGLVPKEHYWPVRPSKLCPSIKFGVDWGNNHTIEAEAMGREGRRFVTKDVNMKSVYDYMLHGLREYAKLLRFEPRTENMTAICSEAFLCTRPTKENRVYMESVVRQPSDDRPCFLPPRNEEQIKTAVSRKSDIIREVRKAEDLRWSHP